MLRSTTEPYPFDLPLLNSEVEIDRTSLAFEAYRKDFEKQKNKFLDFRRSTHNAITHEMRGFAADYLEYVAELNPRHRTKVQFPRRTERVLLRTPTLHSEGAAKRWQKYIDSQVDHRVWKIWHALVELDRETFAQRAPATIAKLTGVNSIVSRALIRDPPKRLADAARTIGNLIETAYWQRMAPPLLVIGISIPHDTDVDLDNRDGEELRRVVFAEDSPTCMSEEESEDCYHIFESDRRRFPAR